MKRFMLNRMIFICICFIFICCAGVINKKETAKKNNEYISPISLVADRNYTTLYIAEATAHQIAVFDIAANRVKNIISLKDQPSGLALDGSRLYATCGSSDGTVEIIDLEHYKVIETISVGHTPCSPVISLDHSKLYICNRFDSNVSVINLSAKKEIAKIPMMREPIAADITPDGKYLFVANHLPGFKKIDEYIVDGGYMEIGGYTSYMIPGNRGIGGEIYNTDYTLASVVLVVNTEDNRLIAMIRLPNGSAGLRGICVSPDGRYVYVTHVLPHYQLPTTQLERGWMNTNALSVIDVAELKLMNTVLLDDVDLGAANPWGVACSPNGDFICVTHAGTHEISIIDRAEFHKKLEQTAHGEIVSDSSYAAEDVTCDLTFLVGLRRRLKLKGNGPRGLIIAGSKVYVAEYFTGTLGVVDIDPTGEQGVRSVALGPIKPLTAERKGEMYFNDANLCFQKWQSCVSCHPDGRTDALNWDLLNDGIGNPKNTKSLLLSHQTPPVMITGVRARAEDAVRAGIKHIQFAVSEEEVAVAIDNYLKSLKRVPSPYLVKGKLNKNERHGKKIFERSGCVECHPAPLYTDLNKYDVGTGTGREKNYEFDTPTLIEIWRTEPYLYDGGADTMENVLRKYNRRNKHGTTLQLNDQEINNLIEFIFSL